MSYSYKYYNEESIKKFGSWLAGFDWGAQVALVGSNSKADFYQKTVTEAMNSCFPLITVRRKSTDCPWINDKIRGLIIDRNGIYSNEGRSAKWHCLQKHITKLIKSRKGRPPC